MKDMATADHSRPVRKHQNPDTQGGEVEDVRAVASANMASMKTPDATVTSKVFRDLQTMRESLEALGPAVAAIKTYTSPQAARRVQATENLWRSIELEFGLVSGREVSQREGSRSMGSSLARNRRSNGELLGVMRRNTVVFPGFQFDPSGKVFPVVCDLITLAKALEVDDASLIFWLCSPSATLKGKRPVDDMTEEVRIKTAFGAAFGVQW